ncbi:MAG: flagellar assembly protein FliW [Clostridiales bacterium]|nr:flagellar assembly protein FliW [Clostridiales bacterium]
MMKINSSRFGIIEVDKDNIIEFSKGIPAFEDFKRYVLLSEEDAPSLYWLQSVDDGDVSFILIDPFEIAEGYKPKLSEKTIRDLKIERQEDVVLLTMLIVPEDMKNMTTNLQSPIIINMKERLGKQVILIDDDYPMRFPVFSEPDGEGE